MLNTTAAYRVERQETRRHNTLHGKWVRDGDTGRDTTDRAAALALAANPAGPHAYQPHRVVEIVTTETVIYDSTEEG